MGKSNVIGFVVNDVQLEKPRYTTIRLAMTAHNLGHRVWMFGVDGFSYGPGGNLSTRALSVSPERRYRSTEVYLAALRHPQNLPRLVPIEELDILMLRNYASAEMVGRAWAQEAGIMFGRIAAGLGVRVLNAPAGLSLASSKLYLEYFPESVRPRTLVTQDREVLKQFVRDENQPVILKPLQGAGGRGVFLVRPEEKANINQIFDAITRDGYLIAQEYLPEAAQGDIRLFLVDGQPLIHKGQVAAFRRVGAGEDVRNNVSAGGEVVPAPIGPDVFALVDQVRPRLVQDGMFFVGLDIAGDKILEINVFSPGGLGNAQKVTGVNFVPRVVEALVAQA